MEGRRRENDGRRKKKIKRKELMIYDKWGILKKNIENKTYLSVNVKKKNICVN